MRWVVKSKDDYYAWIGGQPTLVPCVELARVFCLRAFADGVVRILRNRNIPAETIRLSQSHAMKEKGK